MIDKTKVFANELALIMNDWIRAFTEKCIKQTPDYFYEVAASSTGKYHPQYSLGKGGLIRHTKALVFFANTLLELEHNKERFSSDERDCIIAAGILHDSFKHGREFGKYTVAEHPAIAAQFVKDMGEQGNEYPELIASIIATHMGEWNTDYKSKREILPKPVTDMQKFLHECDYLASRKNINVQFERPYDLDAYVFEDCTDTVNQIIDMCKQLIAGGANRETLIQLIAKENHGSGNPKTIHTKAEAERIRDLIKEVYYAGNKEKVSV